MDGSGNLYGTTADEGASGDGSVFELAKGSGAITTLASFNGTNGRQPGSLILDSSGNLYGTTMEGGASDFGTVFELQELESTAPVITGQPSSQTVTAGSNVTFTASASGTPTPTVQWQLSTDGGTTFTALSGATNSTLTLDNVTSSMGGDEYEAVFTNSAGSATTSAATLTVNAATSAPIITANPTKQSATAGTNVSFTASASGSPTPTVQWQISSDGGKTFSAHQWGDQHHADADRRHQRHERLRIRGRLHQQRRHAPPASAATLTVTAPVAPVITGNPSSRTVTAGQSATFTASASGSPTPIAQWQVSTDGGKTFSNSKGATSTTLTLSNVSTAMNGYEYRAAFSNSAGNVTSTAAILTVHTAPAPNPSPTPTPPPNIPDQIQQLVQDLVLLQQSFASGNVSQFFQTLQDYEAAVITLEIEIFQVILKGFPLL